MAIALTELEEPKTALLEPLAERNGQAASDACEYEYEVDYGQYDPPRPFEYEYDREGYLCSDGQGMAEKNEHRQEINKDIDTLNNFFAERSDVYVAGCDYLHYKRGDRTKHISPDLYVVFDLLGSDVETRNRENFKTWKNGWHLPSLIIEYASRRTRTADEKTKYALYEQIFKTPEYILFDPRIDVRYLKRRLRGYRLNASGIYEPIPPEPTPLHDERFYSEQLGLCLEMHDKVMRFFDPKKGEYLRTPKEEARDRQREEQRANNEARRATQEARKRREAERQARAETQRANEEAQRANEEAAARQAAEQRADDETRLRIAESGENARLRAEIDALRNKADA